MHTYNILPLLHRVCVMPPPIPIMRSYSESLPAFQYTYLYNTHSVRTTSSMGINEGESVPEKFSDWMKTKGKENYIQMRFHSYDGKFSVAHRYNIAIHCTCYCKEDSGGDKSTYISPSKRLDLCSYTCVIAKMYIYAAHSQIEIVNKVYIYIKLFV